MPEWRIEALPFSGSETVKGDRKVVDSNTRHVISPQRKGHF
jgi:hypothetical protein